MLPSVSPSVISLNLGGTSRRVKMEAETLNANHPPGFLHRSLPAVVPILLISIGYVDPGKWVAIAEGGARFGFDLMAFTLIFNLAAIFCQYIAAKIGVITGKVLAQGFYLPVHGFIFTVNAVQLYNLKIFWAPPSKQ